MCPAYPRCQVPLECLTRIRRSQGVSVHPKHSYKSLDVMWYLHPNKNESLYLIFNFSVTRGVLSILYFCTSCLSMKVKIQTKGDKIPFYPLIFMACIEKEPAERALLASSLSPASFAVCNTWESSNSPEQFSHLIWEADHFQTSKSHYETTKSKRLFVAIISKLLLSYQYFLSMGTGFSRLLEISQMYIVL